ncbi:hypothetical protein [Spectribacter hydrogenoxidans]|uniref:Outer membrane protein beta-barrel domain-containing protein n=1 Tax=Spectribacter hydrogenoxidans TaxID=3075608 RepID=A0ABU3BYM7_9GAMM|nr:hypothetical protein [Salinisphaera sp. W335]MDT0634417.1 hypothetical protein [Salinisphaera sp. W335]
MNGIRSAALLLLAGVGTTAVAADYTYVQADWIAAGDIDRSGLNSGFTEEYDGFAAEGAISLLPAVFVQARYDDLEGERGGDARFLQLGAGLNHDLGQYASLVVDYDLALDIYALASYEDIDADGASGDGLGVSGGLRWHPVPALEINPSVGYVDYDELDDSTATLSGFRYALRGLFQVSPHIALSAAYQVTALDLDLAARETDLDFEKEFRLGVRYYFTVQE